MNIQRNVEGLRQNAQKKRKDSFDKVDLGIQEMIRTRQKINFKTVAAACGVSKAFLYKEAEIKSRIDHLRQQYGDTVKIAPEQRPSDLSKDALLRTMRERVKTLTERVKELEHQNAVLYGEIAQNGEIKSENRRLKTQLASSQSIAPKPPSLTIVETIDNVVSFEDKQSLDSQILESLEKLGIKATSTLQKVIRSAPESVVLTAIAALRKALVTDRIENPGGWLKAAIENQWVPNAALEKQGKTISNSQATPSEIAKADNQPTKELLSIEQIQELSTIFNQKHE